MGLPRRATPATSPERSHNLRQALTDLKEFAHIHDAEDAPQPVLPDDIQRFMKEWLFEINRRDQLDAVDAERRNSIMLFGLPGTGKTTIAWHIAQRRGVKLVAVQSQHISSCYLAEGGKNVTRLFNILDPIADDVVVLFDEFDSIGAKRGGDSGADHERAATLNALLIRLERYEGIVLAATNRKEEIDPALFRRFRIQLPIDLPGPNERYAIVAMYAQPYILDPAAIEVLQDCLDGAAPDTIKKMMQGMKRALVLWPEMGRDISNPAEVFDAVKTGILPPIGMPEPKLWTDVARCFRQIAAMPWPPVLDPNRPKRA